VTSEPSLYGNSWRNALSRQRRTLITSNRSPSKTIYFTGFSPSLLERFSQSRTSIR